MKDKSLALAVYHQWEMPSNLCFDRDRIMTDYWRYRNYNIRPSV